MNVHFIVCVVEWSSFGSRGELGGYMEARIAKLHSQTLAGGYRKNRKKFATLQHVPECYQILPKDLCQNWCVCVCMRVCVHACVRVCACVCMCAVD